MDFKHAGYNLLDGKPIQSGCECCVCATCAHINECEILTDRFEYIEKAGIKECPCSPIVVCSGYSSDKDNERYSSWECLIKNMIGGD